MGIRGWISTATATALTLMVAACSSAEPAVDPASTDASWATHTVGPVVLRIPEGGRSSPREGGRGRSDARDVRRTRRRVDGAPRRLGERPARADA
ncbi:hypothetical protein NKG05_16495 [Oerskovia sp. M15]